MRPQPDGTSCGPTCLHALYSFYGDPLELTNIINEVHALEEGGTLAVLLGIHALKKGYNAKLYCYNLEIFDITWANLSKDKIIEKLTLRCQYKENPKTKLAITSYIDFLKLGGSVQLDELSPALITGFLEKGNPVLTGLSSTYLYQTIRENPVDGAEDDIHGEPAGHFVILTEYNSTRDTVVLADPWEKNPLAGSLSYEVPMQRLINSILLGVLTYDGNLLVITPTLENSHG